MASDLRNIYNDNKGTYGALIITRGRTVGDSHRVSAVLLDLTEAFDDTYGTPFRAILYEKGIPRISIKSTVAGFIGTTKMIRQENAFL